MRDTVIWQRGEGAVILLVCLIWYAGSPQPLSPWLALAVFFAPDVAFAAYLLGNRVGAAAYNIIHSYAAGIALLGAGMMADAPLATAFGMLWLAHAGFDRMLGYGLKSSEGFKVTHLGPIGGGAA